MSRTIRRLPWNGGTHTKWYASCYTKTKPNYADIRIHHYQAGTLTGFRLVDFADFTDCIEFDGYIRIIKSFTMKDSYESCDREFESEIMEFCFKNGTCVRHRMNGVRICKSLDNKEQRNRLKAALKQELTTFEQETPDCAMRWSKSKKRKAKTLFRQKKRYERKQYEKALKQSSAKTFNDL